MSYRICFGVYFVPLNAKSDTLSPKCWINDRISFKAKGDRSPYIAAMLYVDAY